jgi:hypothetical protein
MSAPWRWVVGSIVVLGGIVVACSSSEDGDQQSPEQTAPPVKVKEVARKEIGAAGGSISGGGATIDIPEGAVEDGTTIVINQLEATEARLPKSSTLAGAVYSLLPDDVEFKKPVTVRLAIDPAKKPADGKGAIVIFRAPANTNEWTVKGATGVQGNEVVAQTTHFSWWAPAVAGDQSCLQNRCRLDAGTARGMPEFPGMDCIVPATGPAVHCKGTGPNASAPYECGCAGTNTVLGNYTHPPSDSEISALATQCGGVCPPQVQIPCSISAVCGAYEAADGDPAAIPGSTPGWTCKTTSAPFPMRCSHVPGTSSASCRCDNGKILPLKTLSTPTDDEMLFMWSDDCEGNCNPVLGRQDGGETGGPDSGVLADPCIPQKHGVPGIPQCGVNAFCYEDGYGVDCLNDSPNPAAPVKCQCRKNAGYTGVEFEIASCDTVTAKELATKCSFPEPGDAGALDSGVVDAGPDADPGFCMFNSPSMPGGQDGPCSLDGFYSAPGTPQGQPCPDGEKVVCSPMDASDGFGVCDCIKNGAVFKTVNASCVAPGNPQIGAWAACGFTIPGAPK